MEATFKIWETSRAIYAKFLETRIEISDLLVKEANHARQTNI